MDSARISAAEIFRQRKTFSAAESGNFRRRKNRSEYDPYLSRLQVASARAVSSLKMFKVFILQLICCVSFVILPRFTNFSVVSIVFQELELNFGKHRPVFHTKRRQFHCFRDS